MMAILQQLEALADEASDAGRCQSQQTAAEGVGGLGTRGSSDAIAGDGSRVITRLQLPAQQVQHSRQAAGCPS